MKLGHRYRGSAVLVLVAAVAAISGWVLGQESLSKIALAASVLVAMLAMAVWQPRRMLAFLVVWVAVLGLLRRITTGDRLGGIFDPLLVILPIALGLLFVVAANHSRMRERTRLASMVLAMQAIIVVSAINPLQGSPAGGVAAMLFVVLPMLTFWTGRVLCDDRTYANVLRALAGVGVPVAAYGLFQTLEGFPSWDEEWISAYGYGALNVRGVFRSFSTFSSSAEYASFLMMAVIAWTSAHRLRWAVPALAVAALMVVAVLFAGSRGPIVLVTIGLGVTISARLGVGMMKAAAVGVLAVVFLPTVVGWLAPSTFAGDRSGQLLAHQIEGLSDPFGETSTVDSHLALVQIGMSQVVTDPLGRGFGVVSKFGERLGADNNGTEADPSNLAVAAGVPGLVAYVVLVIMVMRRAYALVQRRRDILATAALGLLVVTFLHWFNGGQYAVCWLVWLTIGWIDRADTVVAEEEAAASHTAVPA